MKRVGRAELSLGLQRKPCIVRADRKKSCGFSMIDIKRIAKRSRLSRFLRKERRFVAFCVGPAKSGTTSVAAMFKRFRSAHEPNSGELIRNIIDANLNPSLGRGRLSRAFKKCDLEYWLEMNSSQLNGFCIDEIESIHPRAKYILTIRPCVAWLESFVNHHYETRDTADKQWQSFREFRFGRYGCVFQSFESSLQKHGLFPTEAYVRFWFDYYNFVLGRCPEDRTIVIRTEDLGRRGRDIESFLHLEEGVVDSSASFQNRRTQKSFSITSEIPKSYLQDVIELHREGAASNFLA